MHKEAEPWKDLGKTAAVVVLIAGFVGILWLATTEAERSPHVTQVTQECENIARNAGRPSEAGAICVAINQLRSQGVR